MGKMAKVYSWRNILYRTAREKSITCRLRRTRGERCNRMAIGRHNLSQLYQGVAPDTLSHRTSSHLSYASFGTSV